ncbi:MAG: ABC transporter permease [Bryobacterales bacterium]|nr:ABC transporter permease [Bryobacterales bacterium]
MRSFGAAASLLCQLALRDFRQRYVGSLLGWLWGVVHPLVLLAVYWFVFRHALGARLPPGEATDNYPLFLLAGTLPWLLFSETLTRSATALSEYSALVKRSVFPPEVVPLSILASTAASHALSLAVLLGAAAIWGHPPSLSLAALPLWALSLALFSLGLAWLASALQVYLKDTAQALSLVLMAWFWATPVFLPESFYRGRADMVLEWNPLRHVVLGYRSAILGGSGPSLGETAFLAGAASAACLLGALFFGRAKRGFPDVL